MSKACGIAVPALQTPHACDTRDLRDVDYQIRAAPTLRCTHTRVMAMIQACGIAVLAPQRPHAGDTRELTSHSRVRVRVG